MDCIITESRCQFLEKSVLKRLWLCIFCPFQFTKHKLLILTDAKSFLQVSKPV
jgi:hypothetical protein